MHKLRVPIFIMSILGVLGITWILIQIGNGYRPDFQNRTVALTGLMVTNSEPKGAQVLINNQIKTATDDTLNLEPGTYQVELKKNGYFPWSKTLKIEPGLVTQTNATLFPSTTDLKAVTYTGIINPTLSPNGSRIVYAVSNESTPSAQANTNPESGIWFLELSDLPLRFNRDPQQIVIGLPEKINPSSLQFKWSYDSQEVMVLIPTSEPDTNKLTKNTKNIVNTPEIKYDAYLFSLQSGSSKFSTEFLVKNQSETLNNWQMQANLRLTVQLSELPTKLRELFATTSAELSFSPDETKILYTAASNSEMDSRYIPEVLSSSSQTETRILTKDHKYIYDIKEDKNFDITSSIKNLNTPKINWFTNSKHLILSNLEGVHLLEFDNTNFTTIYSGPLSSPNIFPHPSGNRILIETTLNPKANAQTNLYAIILK